jgi:hypothetical protein
MPKIQVCFKIEQEVLQDIDIQLKLAGFSTRAELFRALTREWRNAQIMRKKPL